MPLNKQRGNMYDFVDYTWNTIKGKCSHDCYYCYCKQRGEQKPIRFDEKELKTDLGEGNFIFVGSSCDMWADSIEGLWIAKTINHCMQYYKNKYLFQSKNPKRFKEYLFPLNSILGTTIETNRIYPQMGNTPSPHERAKEMREIWLSARLTMITVEPVMDFDFGVLRNLIFDIRPEWVNIGADSGGHKLPEPPKEKILELIEELKKFTEVKLKKNLNRLIK